MPVKTWYPIGDSTPLECGVYPASPTTHYDKVDEVSASDSDYVYGVSSGTKIDIFTHTNDPVPDGATSISIKVYNRARKVGSGLTSTDYIGLKSNGTVYYDAGHALATAFQTFNNTWSTDPATGSAWTVSAANAALFGAKLVSASQVPQCSQVYAEVIYTEPTITGFIMISED